MAWRSCRRVGGWLVAPCQRDNGIVARGRKPGDRGTCFGTDRRRHTLFRVVVSHSTWSWTGRAKTRALVAQCQPRLVEEQVPNLSKSSGPSARTDCSDRSDSLPFSDEIGRGKQSLSWCWWSAFSTAGTAPVQSLPSLTSTSTTEVNLVCSIVPRHA